jgi:HEAT repeat protein
MSEPANATNGQGHQGALHRAANAAEISAEAAIQTVLRLFGQEGFSFDAVKSLVEVSDAEVWSGVLDSAAHSGQDPAQEGDNPEATRVRSAVSTAFTSRYGGAGEEARRRALLDALKSDDADVRAFAAELLGRRGEEDSIEPVAALLNDPDDHVRAVAVRALAAIPSARVLPYLTGAMERYDLVAAEAVQGLAHIGAPAVEPLLHEFRTGNSWTRRHAVKALGLIGDPMATPVLIDGLTDDDSGVRWECVYALAQIGPGVLDPLLRALEVRHVTPWFAEGAGRVLQRVATGELHAAVVPVEQALHRVSAPVEAPVEAARARERLRPLLGT